MSGAGVLGSIDWMIVGAYAGGLVLLGLLLARRNRRPEDYFLASRATRWPAIGLALIASNISSTALVGLAGAGYATGISVYDYEWSASVVLVFFCVFLLPFLLRTRVYTMPEYLERRYDARARLYFALLTLFLNLFVDCAGSLYSGSLVCRLLIPGAHVWWLVAALAGAAGLYAALGGLRAVIYTETVQAIVLLLGAVTIAAVSMWRVGGWHALARSVDPAKLSLIRPASDAAVPWPGLLLGIPLLGFYYWCTNQNIVQRVLSAQDLDQGRSGALLAGALKLLVLFLLVLPGTCALLLYPNLPKSDLVYPTLIFHLLPVGLMGLVAAGFVAATIVCVASILNAAATMVTMDIVKRAWPSLSDQRLVRVGQLSTALILVVAVLWAPQLERMTSLWQYLQGVLAYAVPPVVTLFLVGMFWRGANASGAAATLLVGTILSIALFLAQRVWHWWDFHFLYATPILVSLDCLILVAVSRWRRGPIPASTQALIWTPELLQSESARLNRLPRIQDFRVQAAALIILTLLIVLIFR